MKAIRLAISLCMAGFCQAGPGVIGASKAANAIRGTEAAEAILRSKIASAFGVGCSNVVYGRYILVNKGLLVSPKKIRLSSTGWLTYA